MEHSSATTVDTCWSISTSCFERSDTVSNRRIPARLSRAHKVGPSCSQMSGSNNQLKSASVYECVRFTWPNNRSGPKSPGILLDALVWLYPAFRNEVIVTKLVQLGNMFAGGRSACKSFRTARLSSAPSDAASGAGTGQNIRLLHGNEGRLHQQHSARIRPQPRHTRPNARRFLDLDHPGRPAKPIFVSLD